MLAVGHAAYDLVVPVPAYPAENTKTHVTSLSASSGGPAANAASLLARWGVSTALVAALGDDAYGQGLLADLRADGVLTTLLRPDARWPTPLSLIVTSEATASRTIVTRKVTRPPLEVDEADLEALSGEVRGLVVDGHEPELSLRLLRRWPRAWSLLDAGTLRPGTETLAAAVSHVITSEDYARAWARKHGHTEPPAGQPEAWLPLLQALSRTVPGWLAVTLGAEGCVWCGPDGRLRHRPALAVTARDTTAAGDVFHGAFAYGLLQGEGPEQAVDRATRAAGLSVTRSGGRASIPGLAEVEASAAGDRR